MSKQILWAAIVFVAITIATVIYYWQTKEPEIKTTTEAIEALSETPVEAIAPASNPLQNKVPEVNPVDKTNPFKDVYKNPFSQ